jgi:hypothetical protein
MYRNFYNLFELHYFLRPSFWGEGLDMGYNRRVLLPLLIRIWNTIIPHLVKRVYYQMKTQSL